MMNDRERDEAMISEAAYNPGICGSPICDRVLSSWNRDGYCRRHWYLKIRAIPKAICKIEGCGRGLYASNLIGYCRRHRHLSPAAKRRKRRKWRERRR